ncbi:MAG: methyltransferase domain-containing protein [Verrucomicrobiota bacterium]
MARPERSTHLYPSSFEDWWKTKARQAYPGRTLENCLKPLHSRVSRLSDLFTTERSDDLTEAYLSDEDVIAYGLYFFPQTFGRTRLVTDELLQWRKWQPAHPDTIRILDIGCGSGAGGFALLDALKKNGVSAKVELTGIDQSIENLTAARSLGKELFPSADLRFQRKLITPVLHGPQPLPKGPWDIILMSFSLNELAAQMEEDRLGDWLIQVLDSLEENGICILVEPAQLESATRLMSLQAWLVENTEASIWGPSLHQQAPALLESRKNWSHEVRRWRPPNSLEFLNRRMFRDIQHLKFSYLVIGRNQPEELVASPSFFRSVSSARKTAGKYTISGEAADGQLYQYEWLERNLTKEEKDLLKSWERGDIGTAKDYKEVGSGIRIETLPSESLLFSPRSQK